MRHLTRLTAVLAATVLAGATTAVALGSGTRATGAKRAHLTLLKRSPLTIRGVDFPARTPVTVSVNVAGTHRRRLVTDRTGTFTAVFRSSGLSCSAWTATVTRRGARAIVLRGPRPMCAPAGGYGGYGGY